MLGICVHLLSRYFHTVTHYSVLLIQNQAFFEIIFVQASFTLPSGEKPENVSPGRPLVHNPSTFSHTVFLSRQKFLHKVHTVVIITTVEKMGTAPKGVDSFYVNQKMYIHSPFPMWKTLVDKPVDNVENYELSTGILPLCPGAFIWGKVCIPACIIPQNIRRSRRYVTAGMTFFPVNKSRKSLNPD